MNFLERNKHHIALHGVIFTWGFTGILGRLISIDSVSIVWWRVLIALLGLMAYFLAARQSFFTSRENQWKYLGTGVIIALHWILFFEALKVSNVSITLTTLASTSLFVAFFEPFVFKRRILGYEILLGLGTIGGLLLIFNVETRFAHGILLSLGSAMCAAVFGTLNGAFVQTGKATLIASYEMLGAWVSVSLYLILFPSTSALNMPEGIDWAYLIVLGIICTSLAQVVSIHVMKYISPFTVTISINMEPIYAIAFALLIFKEDEYMSPMFYLGAVLIMGVIFLNGFLKSQFKKRAAQ